MVSKSHPLLVCNRCIPQTRLVSGPDLSLVVRYTTAVPFFCRTHRPGEAPVSLGNNLYVNHIYDRLRSQCEYLYTDWSILLQMAPINAEGGTRKRADPMLGQDSGVGLRWHTDAVDGQAVASLQAGLSADKVAHPNDNPPFMLQVSDIVTCHASSHRLALAGERTLDACRG